jgi:Domain of unknown function (DUF4375)
MPRQGMKISPELFRQILESEDAESAVLRLDQLWCARPGVSQEKERFGLSPAEFALHLYLGYVAEVGNGGHAQFFLNPGGAHAAETLEALATLGLRELHAILAEACAAFPDGRVPRDHAQREASIERVPAPAQARWDELDRKLYTVDRAAAVQAREYLRAHADEVLVPERS